MHPSEVTPEIQKQLDDVQHLQEDLRLKPRGPVASELDLDKQFAPNDAAMTSSVNAIDAHKLKAARVIGPSERGDAVAGRAYTLQLGTMNVKVCPCFFPFEFSLLTRSF